MNYDINERDTSIDNMADTLFSALEECIKRGDNESAIAICEEWIIDGVDPQDGGYEFTFLDNFTLETN